MVMRGHGAVMLCYVIQLPPFGKCGPAFRSEPNIQHASPALGICGRNKSAKALWQPTGRGHLKLRFHILHALQMGRTRLHCHHQARLELCQLLRCWDHSRRCRRWCRQRLERWISLGS